MEVSAWLSKASQQCVIREGAVLLVVVVMVLCALFVVYRATYTLQFLSIAEKRLLLALWVPALLLLGVAVLHFASDGLLCRLYAPPLTFDMGVLLGAFAIAAWVGLAVVMCRWHLHQHTQTSVHQVQRSGIV